MDAKQNTQIEPMIVDIQKMFIERLKAWTRFMAPWGWRRQTRWKQRDWVKLIFMTMQRNTAGRYARRRAIRRIGAALIRLYRDERSRGIGEQRREERQRRKKEARKRIRRILWQIYIRGVERDRGFRS